MKNIDFTNCQQILHKAYAGANGQKICIQYDDKKYMLKFPVSAQNKPTDLSYTNSCICEHIGSSIFNLLEVNAQRTILGTYNVKGKQKIVCACEDFTSNGEKFYDFASIKNTIIDSEHQVNGTELDELLETIEKQRFIDSIELLEFFWDMFVIDAFIGNFDRHNGNWGFLVDKDENVTIAPVFDCGSCLLPQADEKVMKAVIDKEEELNARIYTFPTSAIKINNKKINYFDFLSNHYSNDCMKALNKIYERVDISKINSLIETIPYLSELQVEFYKTYLSARFNKILRYSYNRLL